MTKPKLPPISDERLTYSVPEAAKMLGLSISTLYRYKDIGELEFKKRGNRTFITRAALQEFIDNSPPVSPVPLR